MMSLSAMRLAFVFLLVFPFCFLQAREEEESQTCSWTGKKRDPALKEMTYDVGDGRQTFMAYVEPDISSFYQGKPPSSTKVVPKFNGHAAKVINMSNQQLTLYWESHAGGPVSVLREYTAFSSGGTGTFPGHRFFFTPKGGDTKTQRLIQFVVGDYPDNIYVYDPYLVKGDEAATEANLKKSLSEEERKMYDQWKKTLLFNDQYRDFTGRSYLSNFLRDPPGHFMWPAEYFGQEHWVTTRETHFKTLPPLEEVEPVMKRGEDRIFKESDPRNLQEYRVKDSAVMNMTLRVLSCAPRVFEIPNFLSPAEVQHILELAGGIELSESTTGDGGTKANSPDETTRHKTRTSFNSWVPRERSEVVDAIYRRSADLIRIDEALLRSRAPTEYPDMPTRKTIAESLQLVHYGKSQEYTAHHDFGYTKIDKPNGGARYATLLFYLNDGMKGGETSFPRWANAETFRSLSVTPQSGKAVLFYSQLPDGNMDDFSQHAAEPIKDGEKWLINLWIWDPIYE
jgi:prolyl 4-hydroxylase